jgi:hypothetical protein
VDHYNIEIQVPSPGKPGKYIPEQNTHIIIDKDFSPINIFTKNKSNADYNLINRP